MILIVHHIHTNLWYLWFLAEYSFVRQVTQIILHSRLKWQFTFHYVSNIAYIIMRQYSLTIYNRQQAKHDNENGIITLRGGGGGEFRMHIRLRNPKLFYVSCTFTKLVGIIIRLRLIPLRKFCPHHAMILNTQRNVVENHMWSNNDKK